MQVIVVGAGPCGLLTALYLQKEGIQVRVLDSAEQLDRQPRATHYTAPALVDLERSGVLKAIKERGFTPKSVCWRLKTGERITGVRNDATPESDPLRMVALPLGEVIDVLYEECTAAGVQILMQHLVQSLDQDKNKAWVNVKLQSGEIEKFEADYIIGCDGANSQIRRALFGDWEFPGTTWPKQIIATNVYYPFDTKFGWEDSNFIIDQDNWFMAAKITKDGLWRVTYGDVPNLTKEEYVQRLPAKFNKMLPGAPTPDQFEVTNVGPYKMHQRLAEKMRVGRFLLAGDAAHLCNPFGGLGLTGGICDVGGLYECLAGIHRGVADESILERYSEIRREKYMSMVDPISTANFKRLWEKTPEDTVQNDDFFVMLRKGEQDPAFGEKLTHGLLTLRHDFTQYYKSELGS